MTFPRSIDTSGTRDATQALNGWLGTLDRGTTVTFPAKAMIRVDGTISLSDKHDLTIDGNGTTLFAASRDYMTRRHLVIDGGTGITIRNLTIVGAHDRASSEPGSYQPEYEGQHGIAAYGTDNLTLERVRIHHTYGDALYLGRHPYTRLPCTDVTVTGCHFHNTGRHGIAVTDGHGIDITGNIICQTARASIDLEPNSQGTSVTGVGITGNIFGPGRLMWIAAAGNQPIGNVGIVDNQLIGKAMTVALLAPEGASRHGFTITGNTSDAPPNRTPIQAVGITGLVVTGNTCAVKYGSTGVSAKASTLDVHGNTFTFPDGSPAPQLAAL